MATFNPQLVLPAAGDPYYNTIKSGGYNPCIQGNPQRREKNLNVLPNCVGYATGRFNAIGEYGRCKYLGNTNAANFIDLARRQGLEISQVPTNTTWYNSVQRYAVGQWTMHKSVQDTAPTYSTSRTANQGVTTAIYKNSTSTSTSYTRTSAMNTNVFSSSNASNAALTCVRLKSGNVLSYYVNTSSYGLLPNMEYKYIVIYSE